MVREITGMIGSSTLEAMIAAGLTGEQMLDIVRGIEADAKPKDRTGAERQARHRDKMRAERDAVTRDITRGTVTAAPSPLAPPLKSPPDPQKITPPISPQPIVVETRDPFDILQDVIEVIADDVKKKLPAPVGVDRGQWTAFRKQRKKALTDRAYLMICKKLSTLAEDGWPPGDMIDRAIERGWETVFEPKDNRNGLSRQPATPPGNNLRGSRPDPCVDMLRAANAELAEEAAGRHSGASGEAWLALPSIGSG